MYLRMYQQEGFFLYYNKWYMSYLPLLLAQAIAKYSNTSIATPTRTSQQLEIQLGTYQQLQLYQQVPTCRYLLVCTYYQYPTAVHVLVVATSVHRYACTSTTLQSKSSQVLHVASPDSNVQLYASIVDIRSLQCWWFTTSIQVNSIHWQQMHAAHTCTVVCFLF